MTRQRGQAMVEFGITFGLLMLVVVLTAEIAIYLHQRNSLQLVAKEAACGPIRRLRHQAPRGSFR